MNWLIARLKESSSWRGLIWLLTVAGVALNPEQTEALIVAGMAVAGLLGVFTKDKPNDRVMTSTHLNTKTPLHYENAIKDKPNDLPPIELVSPRSNIVPINNDY